MHKLGPALLNQVAPQALFDDPQELMLRRVQTVITGILSATGAFYAVKSKRHIFTVMLTTLCGVSLYVLKHLSQSNFMKRFNAACEHKSVTIPNFNFSSIQIIKMVSQLTTAITFNFSPCSGRDPASKRGLEVMNALVTKKEDEYWMEIDRIPTKYQNLQNFTSFLITISDYPIRLVDPALSQKLFSSTLNNTLEENQNLAYDTAKTSLDRISDQSGFYYRHFNLEDNQIECCVDQFYQKDPYAHSLLIFLKKEDEYIHDLVFVPEDQLSSEVLSETIEKLKPKLYLKD